MMKKDMKQLLWITGVSVVLTAGVMAAALLLLASCTQDDGGTSAGTGSDPNLRVPLTVSTVSLAGGGSSANTRTSTDTRRNADTRAAGVPISVTDGKLWVGVRAGNGYTAPSGLIYTYTAGAWTTPAPLMLSKDPVSLYAYYPQDGYTPAADGTIQLRNLEYSVANDLCYTTNGGDNVCSIHPYAGFVLRHVYARLKVNIIFSSYFGDASTVDAVTVTAGGFYSEGTLNVASGAVSLGPGTQPKLDLTSGQTMADIHREYYGDMLVLPAASMTDAELTIIVSGKKWKADLSSALTGMEAGKSYRIKAQIDLTGVELVINAVEVEDWTTGASHSGDTQFE